MPVAQGDDLLFGKSIQDTVGGDPVDPGDSGYLLVGIGDDRTGMLVCGIKQVGDALAAFPEMRAENILMKQNDAVQEMRKHGFKGRQLRPDDLKELL